MVQAMTMPVGSRHAKPPQAEPTRAHLGERCYANVDLQLPSQLRDGAPWNKRCSVSCPFHASAWPGKSSSQADAVRLASSRSILQHSCPRRKACWEHATLMAARLQVWCDKSCNSMSRAASSNQQRYASGCRLCLPQWIWLNLAGQHPAGSRRLLGPITGAPTL